MSTGFPATLHLLRCSVRATRRPRGATPIYWGFAIPVSTARDAPAGSAGALPSIAGGLAGGGAGLGGRSWPVRAGSPSVTLGSPGRSSWAGTPPCHGRRPERRREVGHYRVPAPVSNLWRATRGSGAAAPDGSGAAAPDGPEPRSGPGVQNGQGVRHGAARHRERG